MPWVRLVLKCLECFWLSRKYQEMESSLWQTWQECAQQKGQAVAQCYLFIGQLLLKVGTEKNQTSLSFSCRGIVKKQSFRSIMTIGHSLVNKEGNVLPGCREPVDLIILLIGLRSFNILYLPNFFLMTNTREFQRLVDSSICWDASCSWTRCSTSCCFSLVIVHWSIQMGWSVNQLW